MTLPTEFYKGTDWECSSGPILSRMVALADLWPVGLASETGGGDKDVLEDGLHPVVAIGPMVNRPNNLIGVVMTYTNEHLVIMNMADTYTRLLSAAFSARPASLFTVFWMALP